MAEPAAARTPVTRTPVIDGSRRTDLVLTVLLALYSSTIVTAGLDPVTTVAGLVVAALELPSILLRRYRPRAALLVYAVPAALGYAIGVPSQPVFWTVLAFALLRSPDRTARAVGYLAVLVAATVAASALGLGLVFGAPGDLLLYAITGPLALSLVLHAGVGAVLGYVTRVARARERERREVEERERVAAALDAERTRIADEVGSGVVRGLRRLADRAVGAVDAAGAAGAAGVDRADGPDRSGPELRDQARDVLAGMRRALAALREPPAGDGSYRSPVRATRTVLGYPVPLPTRSGLALAVAFGLVAAVAAALPVHPVGRAGVDRLLPLLDVLWANPLSPLLLLVQLAAVGWWRSAPVGAFAVATLAAVGNAVLGGTNAIVELTWMVLVYGIAAGAAVGLSAVVTAVGTLAVLGVTLALPSQPGALPASGTALGYVAVPVLWWFGVLRRGHRARAEAARVERQRRAEHRAREHERLRVARELHDVVAHHVSAISIQAAAVTVTDDPAVRAEAFGHIAESGRRIAAALPELAGLTPDPGGVALTPDGLDELVRPVRDAGLPVTGEVRGEPAEPAGDPELFAQRIVTEALTNVARHAGPSATSVHVEHAPDAVTLRVADAGPVAGHRRTDVGSGLGLVGMRERAQLLGGWVEAGAGADGGWCVRARLPRRESDVAAGLVREEETRAVISSPATTRPVVAGP